MMPTPEEIRQAVADRSALIEAAKEMSLNAVAALVIIEEDETGYDHSAHFLNCGGKGDYKRLGVLAAGTANVQADMFDAPEEVYEDAPDETPEETTS